MSNSRCIKVHLTGSEGNGWALDSDLMTTRASLEMLNDLVELTSWEEAEVIQSVWEWPLLQRSGRELKGKRVLCHVCNNLPHIYRQSCMVHADARISCWIAMSREAESMLQALRFPNRYVPYSVDAKTFTSVLQAGMDPASLRARWNLPADKFIVSNFMRDSLGSNLMLAKPQKGVELFVEIMRGLVREGLPVHVLLAGPRRHAMRSFLSAAGVPFTYVGQMLEGDDNQVNILDSATINLLYNVSDVHLITSRWEGGPRSILEAASARVPVVSTRVGIAMDILQPECLYSSPDEAVRILCSHCESKLLAKTVDVQFDRIMRCHTPEANVPLLENIYRNIDAVPVISKPVNSGEDSLPTRTSSKLLRVAARIRHPFRALPGAGLTIGFAHEFHKPPYGGGNQFMMALSKGLNRLGVRVVTNKIASSIDAYICNSSWFNVEEFVKAAEKQRVRMIHRVDGPISVYRQTDKTEDNRVYNLNHRLASATAYQSAWCFRQLRSMGYEPVSPVIIRNAVDDSIFHPRNRIAPPRGRKIRLISTAWSDNPLKGGPFMKWLEEQLDWSHFEYTFVGRTKEQFSRIRRLPPLPSRDLAGVLRQHDIYIMASRHEACSNALIEALACGLPVLYINDGGNAELTGLAGLPFFEQEEAIPQLERLAGHYESFQNLIYVESMEEVSLRYLELAQEIMKR